MPRPGWEGGGEGIKALKLEVFLAGSPKKTDKSSLNPSNFKIPRSSFLKWIYI